MSDIEQLKNVPEVNFIEHMTLQETEEQLRAEYARRYKEITGNTPVMGKADPVTLLIKAFAMVEYQTMQYVERKGRAEMLKTSTGEYLDALVALLGIQRQGATRATATVRFTLSAVRRETTAIPAGTRVKTESGKYFRTIKYAEIPAGPREDGEMPYTDVSVEAEEPGADSTGISAGEINTLVDPIPYMKEVRSTTASSGGIDIESDDNLTERAYLVQSRYGSAGTKKAYEYFVREWRSDVEDVQIVSPSLCVIDVFCVMAGGKLLDEHERQSLEEYMNDDSIRPICDRVFVKNPSEKNYTIDFTYWIASSDQTSVKTIQENVNKAVADYEVWQRKMGRDINPTELIARVRMAGAKRVKLTAPDDLVTENVELPNCQSRSVKYGGLEDD